MEAEESESGHNKFKKDKKQEQQVKKHYYKMEYEQYIQLSLIFYLQMFGPVQQTLQITSEVFADDERCLPHKISALWDLMEFIDTNTPERSESAKTNRAELPARPQEI